MQTETISRETLEREQADWAARVREAEQALATEYATPWTPGAVRRVNKLIRTLQQARQQHSAAAAALLALYQST